MSNFTYNILNGDSLKERFPKKIKGEIYIARECLVDGNVNFTTNEELFEQRSNFVSKNFSEFTKEDYFNYTVSQFNSISNLPKNSEINLWFEDDLFCQVNLWFIFTLLKSEQTLYLIRPKKNSPYSFGHMTQEELIFSFHKKTKINKTEFEKLKQLWLNYQKNDIDSLKIISQELNTKFPFLIPVIKAHENRISIDNKISFLEQECLTLIKKLKTKDFIPFFKAFSNQFGIYGFGDIQVSNIHKEIIKKYNL